MRNYSWKIWVVGGISNDVDTSYQSLRRWDNATTAAVVALATCRTLKSDSIMITMSRWPHIVFVVAWSNNNADGCVDERVKIVASIRIKWSPVNEMGFGGQWGRFERFDWMQIKLINWGEVNVSKSESITSKRINEITTFIQNKYVCF